ncbi:MAG: ribonuclease HI family protein [Pseudomonadota bacterium]
MSAEKSSASLPFFQEEKEISSPSEEKILRYLAQTLSVAKTLKRFPLLKAKDLQDLLVKSAQRISAGAETPQSLPPQEGTLEFFIHTDGAARGNPGEAGIGAVIADPHGRTVKELKRFLGMATNNVAEYQAVIFALEKARQLGAASVRVYLDSELVARQLRGEYRVREPYLKTLHRQAIETLNRFSKYSINNIPREENRRADQLANEAIDQRITGATE